MNDHDNSLVIGDHASEKRLRTITTDVEVQCEDLDDGTEYERKMLDALPIRP